jgi:hypothetical protein
VSSFLFTEGKPQAFPYVSLIFSAIYFLVEKRRMVVDWKVSPGFSSVEGKFGWFGESGKCWVSRQNAVRRA